MRQHTGVLFDNGGHLWDHDWCHVWDVVLFWGTGCFGGVVAVINLYSKSTVSSIGLSGTISPGPLWKVVRSVCLLWHFDVKIYASMKRS